MDSAYTGLNLASLEHASRYGQSRNHHLMRWAAREIRRLSVVERSMDNPMNPAAIPAVTCRVWGTDGVMDIPMVPR